MNRWWKFAPFVIVAPACLSEGRFGKFGQAEVLAFSVEGEIAPASIDPQERDITVNLAADNAADDVAITVLRLSSLASASLAVGDRLDLSDEPQELLVRAEDGTRAVWSVRKKANDPPVGTGGDTSLGGGPGLGGLGGSGTGGEATGTGGTGDLCPSTVATFSITGLFSITDTPGGLGDGQFTVGPGTLKLRVVSQGLGAGEVRVLEYTLPEYFVVDAPGAVTTTDLQTSAGPDPCGLAVGALQGTRIQWADCDYGAAPPHGTTQWGVENVVGGSGCLNDFHVQGAITCKGPFCAGSGVDFPINQNDLYPQPLNHFLFSEDFSTFSMRAEGAPTQGSGRPGVELPNTQPSRSWLGLDGTLITSSCEQLPSCN